MRLGLFAWVHRRGITRLVVGAVVGVLVLPVLLALAVVAALAGTAPPPGGATGPAAPGGTMRPMPTWVVTQPFGCTGLGIEPSRGDCPHFHFGIDLAAPAGTEVASVEGGQAEVLPPAGPGGGYGLHVVVRHAGGLTTMYAHLVDVVVSQGQAVLPGTPLGHEGSTGVSTGPHLHFEVREAGTPVNPISVFPGIFGPEGQPR